MEDRRYEIEIANLQQAVEIDENMVYRLISFVLREEDIEEAEISIAFVDEEEIKKLNEEYRKIPEPTDVLAFLYEVTPYIVGEIIVAPEYVERQARQYGVAFMKELTMLLIHGMLHLLGYEHEKSSREADLMWRRQEELERKFYQQNNIS